MGDRVTSRAGRSKTSRIVKCTACVGAIGAMSLFTPSALAASRTSQTKSSATTISLTAATAAATTFNDDDCYYDAPNKTVNTGTFRVGAEPDYDLNWAQFSVQEAYCLVEAYSGPLSTNKQLISAESALLDAGYVQSWLYDGWLPGASSEDAIQTDLQNASADLASLLAHSSETEYSYLLYDAGFWIAYAAGWTIYDYTDYWYGDTNPYAVFALDLVENDESSGNSAYDGGNYTLATTDYLAYLWAAYELAPPNEEL